MSLMLSPLWDTSPPLDGPGVPMDGVEWASSMSLQEEGFWGGGKRGHEHLVRTPRTPNTLTLDPNPGP